MYLLNSRGISILLSVNYLSIYHLPNHSYIKPTTENLEVLFLKMFSFILWKDNIQNAVDPIINFCIFV